MSRDAGAVRCLFCWFGECDAPSLLVGGMVAELGAEFV